MFHHARIEQATGLKIYFADQDTPWQCGSNENINGPFRQYLLKGTDLSVWSQEHLAEITTELNDRPHQCLGDRTPRQMMRQSNREYELD